MGYKTGFVRPGHIYWICPAYHDCLDEHHLVLVMLLQASSAFLQYLFKLCKLYFHFCIVVFNGQAAMFQVCLLKIDILCIGELNIQVQGKT